jgi:hypothetical protein
MLLLGGALPECAHAARTVCPCSLPAFRADGGAAADAPPAHPCAASPLQGAKSFFSEIIASISDIRFSRDGRYILSRDYMTVKLWDLAKESAPVVTFNVHEGLRQRVSIVPLGLSPTARVRPRARAHMTACLALVVAHGARSAP